jgi:hypothetical protein
MEIFTFIQFWKNAATSNGLPQMAAAAQSRRRRIKRTSVASG